MNEDEKKIVKRVTKKPKKPKSIKTHNRGQKGDARHEKKGKHLHFIACHVLTRTKTKWLTPPQPSQQRARGSVAEGREVEDGPIGGVAAEQKDLVTGGEPRPRAPAVAEENEMSRGDENKKKLHRNETEGAIKDRP